MRGADISSISEKERKIYEGLSRLICSGQDVRSITANDIAREAGVGKGTLYLYFKTKDDIIIKTALYMLWQETERMRESIAQEKLFLGKCYRLFDMLCPPQEDGFSILNMFLMLHTLTSDETMLTIANEYRRRISDEIGEMLSEIIDCGIESGDVPESIDKQYLMQGIISALSGVAILSATATDREKLHKNARHILGALLNYQDIDLRE